MAPLVPSDAQLRGAVLSALVAAPLANAYDIAGTRTWRTTSRKRTR